MLRKLLRPLAKLAPAGTRVPIVAGPLRGATWLSGASAGEGRGLAVCLGLIEPAQLETAARLASAVDTCFDIGANVGLYSLLFARHCPRVFAFEPLTRNVAWLHRTLEANRCRNVAVIPVAVTDLTGLVNFEEGINCAMGHIANGSGTPVPALTIDAFVAKSQAIPGLIKVDVEGAEYEVLDGASRTLREHHPHLLLSVHSAPLRDACLAKLRTLGYESFDPLDETDPSAAMEFCVTRRPAPAELATSLR